MQIVSALDVHRRQITYRTVEPASGETGRGRISPAARERVRARPFRAGPPPGLHARPAAGRRELATLAPPPAGREVVELCLRMLDQLDRELAPIDHALRSFARRQPGCRALTGRLYGVGAV